MPTQLLAAILTIVHFSTGARAGEPDCGGLYGKLFPQASGSAATDEVYLAVRSDEGALYPAQIRASTVHPGTQEPLLAVSNLSTGEVDEAVKASRVIHRYKRTLSAPHSSGLKFGDPVVVDLGPSSGDLLVEGSIEGFVTSDTAGSELFSPVLVRSKLTGELTVVDPDSRITTRIFKSVERPEPVYADTPVGTYGFSQSEPPETMTAKITARLVFPERREVFVLEFGGKKQEIRHAETLFRPDPRKPQRAVGVILSEKDVDRLGTGLTLQDPGGNPLAVRAKSKLTRGTVVAQRVDQESGSLEYIVLLPNGQHVRRSSRSLIWE